jgi:hypothetical protein
MNKTMTETLISVCLNKQGALERGGRQFIGLRNKEIKQ